ncbi:hypothetical protein MKW94_006162 [Papaver nudicaule]|uniref:Uncharacterized protein n=1 Tax=Papaver nudicaule TaxID=74823 RepID=A0AA42B562_PAPNU|nr:hypothetical protein [Papaver nudicaule]
MLNQLPSFRFLLLAWGALLVTASLPNHGLGAECGDKNAPTVKQTKVGFGNPPKFMVEVQNNCTMCPAINIHVKCGSFTQDLVNPRLLKVLGKGDCVINGGLPLGPLQRISFNYTHTKFNISTSTWYFQCE